MIPFGPYRLYKRIAVGGMAEVFLATHTDRPQGHLVVKRILPHLEAKPDFVDMFEDEARLSSQLLHRNLVRINDCGTVDGVHYIAMEYVDGVTLSRLLRHLPARRLPFGLSCWIIAEACAGVGYAHGLTNIDGTPLGIVHRDISPDNILLSRTGAVKLADFGIAKASTRLTQTRPGQRKGKLTYMSPEQLLRANLDHRSDLFSLGSVLYELTTGRRVFGDRDDVEILSALTTGVYTAPQETVDDYPPALAAVVQRALAHRPESRFQEALEMRRALLATLVPSDPSPAAQLALLVEQLTSDAPSDFDDSGPTTMPRSDLPLSVSNADAPVSPSPAPTGRQESAPRSLAAAVDEGTARLVALRGPVEVHSETSSPPAPAPGSAEKDSAARPLDAAVVAHRLAPAERAHRPDALESEVTASAHNNTDDAGEPAPYYADEVTLPLDDASLRAIEGAPWGWLVIGAVAISTAAVLLLLYLQK